MRLVLSPESEKAARERTVRQAVEIRDLIEGYFAQQGDTVRAYLPRGRKRDYLSTWEVETIEDAELLMAAE
jgi:hypothetical protein